MAWTQTDLDRLDRAIAQGALRVSYADRTVQYHSLEDMLRLRDRMAREIAGSAASPRYTVATHHRDIG